MEKARRKIMLKGALRTGGEVPDYFFAGGGKGRRNLPARRPSLRKQAGGVR